MFKNYFCFLAIVILASCNKSDFTKEETFISVFESTATLTRQTYDDGVILLTKEGSSSLVYRMDKDGRKIWKKDISYLFSSHANLSFTTVTSNRDGGCLLGGNFNVDSATYYRSVLFIFKLDQNGQVVFEINTDTMVTAGVQSFEDIIQAKDGNWVGIVNRNSESRIIRINKQGQIIANSNIDYSEFWKKIIQTSDEGYAAMGYFNSNYIIEKFDSSFINEWSKIIFPISTNSASYVTNVATDFIEMPNTDLLICGHSSALNKTSVKDFDFFITKLNASGDSLLSNFFSNPYNDYSKNLIITRDNKILITGTESSLDNNLIYSYSYSRADENNFYRINSSSRCFVIKLNTDLSQIWSKSYGNGFGSDGLITVERPDGSYLICGNQVSYGNKNALLLFTIKALKNGNLP